MPNEIERKFLVDKVKWAGVEKPQPILIKQGYLHIDKEKSIRVRIADNSAYITIKGKRMGMSRKEFEYSIPLQDAEQMMVEFCSKFIEKKRYKIIYNNQLWEVDEFVNPTNNLLLAEIELKDENQEIELPEWITEEVTNNEEFYNVNILRSQR